MNTKRQVSIKGVSAILLSVSVLLLAALIYTASAAEDYISTGLGETTREMHPEYPLRLEFSLRTGLYLADVDVEIFQDGKKVKGIHSPGPWLFVNLAPGSYSVTATLADGRKQGARFTIAEDKQQQVILSWPEK